ncbi:MAG: hypothetical protein QM767_03985 [Anaeromyxobacter sp.]
MRTSWAPAAAMLAALAIAVPSLAEAQHVAKGKKKADVEVDTPATAAVDESGRLRAPTREELEALSAATAALVNESTEGLTPVQLPDGSRVVNLEDHFQSVAVATTRGAKVDARCVTSPEEARALAQPTPPVRKSDPPLQPATPALEER